jgi:hypothetical protein
MRCIGDAITWRINLRDEVNQVPIFLTIDQFIAGFERLNKQSELVHIGGIGRKNIHMIPGNASDDRYMRLIMQEFRPGVQGAA